MRSPTVRTLLRLLRPHFPVLPALVLLGVLASLAEGIGIGLLIPLLQTLQGNAPIAQAGPLVEVVQRYAAAFSEDTRFALVGATIIGLLVVKSVLLFSYISFAAWIYTRTIHSIRSAQVRQLLSVGYIYFARHDAHRLLSIMTNSTWLTIEAQWLLFKFLNALCTAAVFVVLLLLISWQMTLVTLAGAMLGSLAMWWLGRHVGRWGRIELQAFRGLDERILELLNSMRIIRMFNREGAEQARFDKYSHQIRRVQRRILVATEMVTPALELAYAPLFVGALAVAWYRGIGVPTLIVFLALIYRMLPYVKTLEHARVSLAGHSASVADVAALLDDAGKPYTRSGAVPFHGLRDGIAFDNVTFRYGESDADHPALANVSFRVNRGDVVAIVGGSGSGKSTIINLLCRLYDPTDGEITVDGRPLRDLDLAAWRDRVTIAGQDVELMSGTVLENIAYGRPDADRSAIIEAARQADAHGFIEALPEGYDTSIGVRGLTLSGGQRQRIGLARALLRQPDVLILDEATNALDGLSELAVQQTLVRLAARLTIIVIAHRLSTIRNADRAIVLDGGRVVEEGRLDELLGKRAGPFARLHTVDRQPGEGRAVKVG
jgi:subfamily B ATP-binding cassette protein MsbA